jgi:hypothetical protein
MNMAESSENKKPVKIWIGRSGKAHGPYDLEEVKLGLESGVFLESDYGLFEGMENWQKLPAVIKSILETSSTKKNIRKSPPKDKSWRDLDPTPKQLRFLNRREIPFSSKIKRGDASDLIAELPENYRKLKADEIRILKANGVDIATTTHAGCVLRLERLKQASISSKSS